MGTKKLKSQGIKILKMFHIFFAFSWIMGALAICVLAFIVHPQSGDELYMCSRIIQILDDYFIIGGAFGAFFTGLVYSIWTNWGFFKHRWVIVKWILIIVQMTFGTFLGPFINNNVIIAEKLGDAALTDPTFFHNLQMTQIGGSIQAFFLLVVVVISVQKPWRKANKKK